MDDDQEVKELVEKALVNGTDSANQSRAESRAIEEKAKNVTVNAFESGRASAARSEVESSLLTEHVYGVTQGAIDEGRISAARSDAASRLTGEAIRMVEQPLIVVSEPTQNSIELNGRSSSQTSSNVSSSSDSSSESEDEAEKITGRALESGMKSAEASRAASTIVGEVLANENQPEINCENDSSTTPIVNEVVAQVLEDGVKSAEISRSASAMVGDVLSIQNTTEEEEFQTDVSIENSSITPEIKAVVENVLEVGLESAQASRAASRVTQQAIADSQVLTPTPPKTDRPVGERPRPSSRTSSRSSSRPSSGEKRKEVIHDALEDGMRSAQRSALNSRAQSAGVRSKSGKSRPASSKSTRSVTFDLDYITAEAIEDGLKSAQRSAANSRMNVADGSRDDDMDNNPSEVIPEGEYRKDTFTPLVMTLIEQAIQDGRLSAAGQDEYQLSRMTPMVMKLIEEAVRDGHVSAMKSATPAHTNISEVSLSQETLEMRFIDLVKLVYLKSISESLSLTEFSCLTDEILEITSILALMLRDGQSSTTVRKNSHKLENCLQDVQQKLGSWDISSKDLAVMHQQITIAQTLLQATQLLGRELSKIREMTDTPDSGGHVTPAIDKLTAEALQDGRESAVRSEMASVDQEGEDYSSDNGSESDSDSEESDSNEDSSSASSSASEASSRSVSPTEKKIISEEIGTLVGSALEDGMISANRSAAASRASVNIQIEDEKKVENLNDETKEKMSEPSLDDTPSSSESSSDEEDPEKPEEPVFVPREDFPGEKSMWTKTGDLLFIFKDTEKFGSCEISVDDELLELALGHNEESLSSVYHLNKPDADYTLLIPFETAYRSPAREVSIRASRDGIKWIRIPVSGTEHELHEDIKFAQVKSRHYSFITLVYGIRSDRLEVPTKGAMLKCHSDSRIYFQFPHRLSRHKLVLNIKVTPVSLDLVNRVKSDGDNCRQLISTSPIMEPEIPAYNYPLRKSFTLNCPCLFSQQLLKKNQLMNRRMSVFGNKENSMLLNIEAGYKVDEPVYLLIQNRDNEWIVEKEIKLRESKKQKGLVSFDLLYPVKRLMLIRTDGALTDDRILHIFNELLSYQTKHYVKILVNPNLNNPTDSICAVINEKEIQNFDAEYGSTSLAAYANADDDDDNDNLLPIREGQQIWFNVEGNISVADGGFNGWVPIRYRRHKLTARKLKLSIVNKYGNHSAESYRGAFRVLVSGGRPLVEKMSDMTDQSVCTRPGDPPFNRSGEYILTKSIGNYHMTFKFNRTLTKLPVTLPKVPLEEIQVTKPKLVRQPSLLDLSKIDEEKPQDAAEKLAGHLSEYETKRLGESMGLQQGNMGLIKKMNRPERIRTMIISWRRAEPIMTDTRTYLADKLTEMGRSDLQRLVIKKSNISLPPIVNPSRQNSTLHAL